VILICCFPKLGVSTKAVHFYLALLNKSVDWKQEIFVGMNAIKFKWLYISASQMKSIATKMLWGFTFVPRIPKITTFSNSEAAPSTEALFCF